MPVHHRHVKMVPFVTQLQREVSIVSVKVVGLELHVQRVNNYLEN
jgi:hypothetical protein